MDFQLNAEQAELKSSVHRLLEKHYEFEVRKRILASTEGHSPATWAQLAEMGVVGMAVPEARGGYASGADVAVSLAPIMQEIGESLALEPVAGHLVAAWLLAQCKRDTDVDELLAAAISGEASIALAIETFQCDTLSATQQGGALSVEGVSPVVIGATQARHLLSWVDTGNRLSLFISNYIRKPNFTNSSIYRTQDGMRAADVSFSHTQVHALAPTHANAQELVDAARDLNTLLACAEAIGCMRYACDTTLDYLKTRKQFGQAIGAFQALQHRMVDMTMSLELARGIVDLACTKFDAAMRGEVNAKERQHFVSAAKIKVSDACRHIGQEAIQLHGGMGMAIEMKISHTFKRLTVIAQTFGDVDFHLQRFADTDA